MPEAQLIITARRTSVTTPHETGDSITFELTDPASRTTVIQYSVPAGALEALLGRATRAEVTVEAEVASIELISRIGRIMDTMRIEFPAVYAQEPTVTRGMQRFAEREALDWDAHSSAILRAPNGGGWMLLMHRWREPVPAVVQAILDEADAEIPEG